MLSRLKCWNIPLERCVTSLAHGEVCSSQSSVISSSCKVRGYSTTTTVEKAQAATARSTIERIRERIREIEQQKGTPPGLITSARRNESLDEVKKRLLPENAFRDTFGRVHTYLRISLTERCNLRCLYCMPEEGVQLSPKGNLLTTEEVIRLTRLFASHGVNKVRLTGGEPTLRKDLVDIVHQISNIDEIEDIGLTTNGLMLSKHVMALREAGLTKVNVSLDTLRQDRYIEMCRRNGLGKVLESIKATESLYPYVKINVVVMRGKNDDEIMDFVRMTQARRIDVRFIEFMPFGGNHFNQSHFISYGEVMQRIKDEFGEENVCKLTELPNDTAKVCLHGNAEVNLRDLMRLDESDEKLSEVIQSAVTRKKAKHAGYRHGEFEEPPKSTDDSDRRITDDSDKRSFYSQSQLPLSTVSFCPTLSLNSTPSPSISAPLHLFSPNHLVKSLATSHRFFSSDSNDNNSLLTHTTSAGTAKQVDVSNKQPTVREAVAEGKIKLTAEICRQIKMNSLKKGDVLNVARIASVMAAKQTSNLVPLCHNIFISQVHTEFYLDEDASCLLIRSFAKTFGTTGIELEALTAVSVAALTVYDMCKAVSSEMEICDIKLVRKTGGKKNYLAENRFSDDIPFL
ncbi:hypothetical protein WR25_04027 [Diploscapter pachys]|uniref:cyclic pyranopterin monophosphate synthase n=1 Tax=Diploscapter pachys TaxID=2018661 RepID=A0A2A2KLW2_9BILA|nr:hypothetical protein WR25_04027 [Diploscapter pachys]